MSEVDAYLNIDTPENVAFNYEVAGIGSRFMAATVDLLIIGLLLVMVYIIAAAVMTFQIDILGDLDAWILALLGLFSFALYWGYYFFFDLLWNGQSPGKRWIGLRVIRVDGTPITLTESLIRNLVRMIDFLPAYYGVGVVTMFIDAQTRRLGDLAAGTLVVRDRHSMVSLDSLAPTSQTAYLERDSEMVKDIPLERLTYEDLQMLEDYMRRRSSLSNTSLIAARVARVLVKRMELPDQHFSGRSASYWLQSVFLATRSRQD